MTSPQTVAVLAWTTTLMSALILALAIVVTTRVGNNAEAMRALAEQCGGAHEQ